MFGRFLFVICYFVLCYAVCILLIACASPAPTISNLPSSTTTDVPRTASTISTGEPRKTPTVDGISRALTERAQLPTYTVPPVRVATPDLSRPTETPSPTIGPTAQFSNVIPISEWKTLTDTVDGFRIKYPPDWYVHAPSPDQDGSVRTFQFSSFDPNDWHVGAKGATPSPNLVVLEITTDDPNSMGHPYVVGEPFTDWVRRTYRVVEGYGPKLLQEKTIVIGGKKGVIRVSELFNRKVSVFLPLEQRVLLLNYPLIDPATVIGKTLQRMIDSIEFLK